MAVDPREKVRKQNQWLRGLCDVEEAALRMCVPIDLMTCEPEVIVCDKGMSRDLFDYWRVVLSSEPQLPHFAGAGRSLALLIRDRVSGGFMGVVALSDPPNHWTQLIKMLGWDERDDLRLAHQHRICMMRRCLPVYEFGRMTGGKFLALTATSQEVMRVLDLRYSYQLLFLGIRTLHGKGSQYNRLQQRGIELYDVDDTNHGFYGMELRKKALSYLRGETDKYGKAANYSLKDQLAYWRERWLPARMKSQNTGPVIEIDPARYRLSDQLASKRATLQQGGEYGGEDQGSEAGFGDDAGE